VVKKRWTGYASTMEVPADSWFPPLGEVKLYWNRFTFDSWKIGYSSEVVTVPKDLSYESGYMLKYSTLRETGWIYKDKGWINPRTGRKYNSVHSAYNSQTLWEETLGRS